MNGEIVVYKSRCIGDELNQITELILSGVSNRKLCEYSNAFQSDSKYLFVVELNSIGLDYQLLEIIESNMKHGKILNNVYGGLVIKSHTNEYTKSFAKKVVLLLNKIGFEFMGHPLVEANNEYGNFKTWQKTLKMSLRDIFIKKYQSLVTRLINYSSRIFENPKILVVHAGDPKLSNTIMLYEIINKFLKGKVRMLSVENGNISDCKGCSFKTCMYYSEKRSCFYGGSITEEVLPAIEESDIVIWLCPNYNDALSAKLMAVINRMTVLYRRVSFHEKYIFGVIVSGSSGGDCVAGQLLNSLVINKGFIIPANFYVSEIANDSGSVLEIEGIMDKAKNFAQNINKYIK